ncbi:plasmid mobilization protein [Pontibacter indicus]|uniref:Mobilisation protein (MobC) n=1 Tax=Pontibacter indicus TaxID=1317125 RepID=A0A1R3XSC9_9BACT|nr:plasmid mobilization relaxosome protein MobC [Pontibacter indicus]SIT93962.1 mobilisation protein (MobC) [Pontibacter indicus]
METPPTQRPKQTVKKGGRPRKQVRRDYTLVVRLTEAERLLITGKARQAGLSLSAWFRASAKRAVVVARLRPEELASLRTLSGVANNLNQLTRLAHREGLLPLQGICRKVLDQLHHILYQLGRNDRKSDDR